MSAEFRASRIPCDVLGLEPEATTAEIKIRFKALVKRHHPDANGGDRSTEHKLARVIKAFRTLRKAKLV